jgi:superfamily II DNA or RNA helicase
MLTPRRHQTETAVVASRFIKEPSSSSSPTNIVLDCTPGGGKSGACTLFASKLLHANLVDHALWVVPRKSLAEQAEEAFLHPDFNPHGFTLRPNQDNCFPLLRPPHRGVISTYQAIAAQPEIYLHLVQAGRLLLILDEVQFLADESAAAWTKAVTPLVQRARYSLLCSGTLFRNDRMPIPFIDYSEPDDDGLRFPHADIEYPLRLAIAERAIVPIELILSGGCCHYEYNSETYEVDLQTAPSQEESRALQTFLASLDSVHGVIDRMLAHWRDWTQHNYRSRLIVVANRQSQAKNLAKYIESRHGLRCCLAISELDDSQDNLKRFRKYKEGDCLVTVGMAYVGLDVPDLTHMAFLSATRSFPYLLQAFARISRVDYACGLPYERLFGFVFTPDDGPMRRHWNWLRTAQVLGIKDRAQRNPGTDGSEPREVRSDLFVPISATLGSVAYENLAGRLADDEVAQVEALRRECPEAAGLPHTMLATILRKAREVKESPPSTPLPPTAPAESPSERESRKRKRLDKLCRRLDACLREQNPEHTWGSTNRRLVKQFNKSRDQMTEADLDKAIELVRTSLIPFHQESPDDENS